MKASPGHHAIMAQCYSDWAREQVDRAGRTLNPKARNDRLALAEYYSQLAEQELAAAKRLEPALRPTAATPSTTTAPVAQHLMPDTEVLTPGGLGPQATTF